MERERERESHTKVEQPSKIGGLILVLVEAEKEAQHSTAQHSTAQHSTAQHSTAQYQSGDDNNCLRLASTIKECDVHRFL
jgi:hypothetical protein